MADKSVAERFYGMRVDPQVIEVAQENLTDQAGVDLVAAHLGVNYSYFGAIDKTLSGFVILDDEGDNYTLCDVRGDGAVWWQDHETREVYRQFADLEERRSFWAEVDAGIDEDEARAMVAGSGGRAAGADSDGGGGPSVAPSSATLLDRYQWLVWLLAQPMRDRQGRVIEQDPELAGSAAGHLRSTWPTDDAAADALDRELPLLAADPHLAVYWVLHTSLLGQDTARARVLAALGAGATDGAAPGTAEPDGTAGLPELVRAFTATFGTLALDGDVPLVPGFRTRRALLLFYAAAPEDEPAACLTGLVVAPQAAPLAMAVRVILGLGQGDLADAEVAAALDGVSDSVGVEAVRAVLDGRAGAVRSRHADTVVTALAGAGAGVAGPGDGGQVWHGAVTLLETVHRLAGDPAALAVAARAILDHDPFLAPSLNVAAYALDLAGQASGSGDGEGAAGSGGGEHGAGTGGAGRASTALPSRAVLDRHRELRAATQPMLETLVNRPDDEERQLAELADPDHTDPALARVLALRVLYRTDLFGSRTGPVGWALRTVLAGASGPGPVPTIDGGLPAGRSPMELVAGALTAVPSFAAKEIVAEVAAGIRSAADPAVGLLLRVLDRPAPADTDFAAVMSAEQLNEACLKALAPYAHTPEILGALLALAERPADRTVLDPLWSTLFKPDKVDGVDVAAALSDAQAERTARALVANGLDHPNIHVRNAACRRLHSFVLPGAQNYLIGALTEYGTRYAASSPKSGKVLDHGKTEDDTLEDMVACLYSAVTRAGGPAARTALVRRLSEERRSFWRMGDAIGKAFGPGLHAQVMTALRQARDGYAAGCYAYALAGFVRQDPPLLELARELVTWPVPAEEVDRRFFRYALHTGTAAALRTREHDLVRAAHALAGSIAEPPLEPDDHARGRGWTDPLTTDLRADLEAVVSGAADARRERLLAKGVAARAAGRPRRRIRDDSLGLLAGVTVERRLLHDRDTGEVWFLDTDGGAHAFDGYEIVEPPFTTQALGLGSSAGFLAGVEHLSQRALLWSADAGKFAELVRYDDRILLREGVNNGSMDRVGLRFADESAAVAAFSRLLAHRQARGMAPSDPWYLPGRGAVKRIFYTPEPDGGYNSDRQQLMVFGGRFIRRGEVFDSERAAAAAHEEWVLTAERDRNATCLSVEWDDGARRPEDLTVREWIRGRIRNNTRDAVWHVRALTEILDQLRGSGYDNATSAVTVEVGTGVGEKEIAAFEAQRIHPVPDVLRDLWRTVGHARWSVPGGGGGRVLSPAQVLAHRPAARDVAQRYLAAMTPQAADRVRDRLSTLDAVVVTEAGEPVTVLVDGDPTVDADGHGGRVFAHVVDDPEDLWWEKSLAWTLATQFLAAYADIVMALEPRTAQLNVGDRVNPDAQVRRFEQPTTAGKDRPRFCEVLYDPAVGLVSTRTGKVGAVGAVRNRRFADPDRAARKADRLAAKRLADGYVEVTGVEG